MNQEENELVEENDDLQDVMVIQVDRNQSPLRIDNFLNDRIKNVSRTRIQQGIKSGAITVNGNLVKPNFKIAPSQEIKVIVPRHQDLEITPENIPLDIIYEDEELMVINKPAGIVVHPGVGNRTGTLLNAIAFYLKMDLSKSDPEKFNFARLGMVHRIDKETSGLLVIAKTEFSLSHLSKQFFDHTSSREYIALIWGELEENGGTVDVNIGRHPRRRDLFTVFPEGESGKHAITHWEMIERMYYVSLIKCKLETGRTHQIRVHMQSLGHPVFNDERYGGDRIVKGTIYSKYKQFVENTFSNFRRHALHAKTLGFTHPTSGKRMEFDSPLPTEFEALVQAWRSYYSYQKKMRK